MKNKVDYGDLLRRNSIESELKRVSKERSNYKNILLSKKELSKKEVVDLLNDYLLINTQLETAFKLLLLFSKPTQDFDPLNTTNTDTPIYFTPEYKKLSAQVSDYLKQSGESQVVKQEEIVIEAEHSNWGLTGPGSWSKTIYKVYKNHFVEYSIYYRPFNIIDEEPETKINFVKEISQEQYSKLLSYCRELVTIDETTHRNACDGSAWEIKVYKNAEEIWNSDTGYIYGLKAFSDFCNYLSALCSMNFIML